ncbi:pilus (MSHA type) biogenesis protein MshL [Sulfuricurvum sp. IAE1]|uniref:pilus (MSHA type) biogenesis protein MshL n=1 Tax=Sulfuricurvum sp. IAE1 TaxID=2546102 RepID=UPI001046027C|nr:pilus (MSHA type) biogenesis protein MshL [Sulfuricurvum sp. IAE1]MDD3770126.1 pilus (MSHA type) biogenesis protein MshL [Sulfuricurvum sp.]MDX9965628.1 pilus (MSHA type) biogenesis protein MshL [Sulfuricurvum sp.]TDA69232.1 pilus (MSHA type) biogenesis protein MshL [Sulfuricurvum sp. IAE1]
MTSVIKHHARALMLSGLAAALLSSTALQADCTYELFNISSVKGTTVGEFVDQLSEECGMSVIVADPEAEKVLAKAMNKTFLKNLTINEVLDLIIKENDLQYTLQNNVLKISYLQTKTYAIDYIISERRGTGSANITLSSNTGSAQSTTGTSSASSSSSSGGSTNQSKSSTSSESGIKITSNDEVLFWETLDKELESILNRPEDTYTAKTPMINKNAGLITVTATGAQHKRLDAYLNDLEKKMQTQVLIDVKMYSVVFSDASSTGIDWSQLYALQNIKLGFDYVSKNNLVEYTNDGDLLGTTSFTTMGQQAVNNAHAFQLSAKGSLNEVIKFLKTQGDVYAISNPKVMTLNNQPALITAGTELFYKTSQSNTLAGGSTGTTSQTEIVSSVFSGVLLDITPEIAKDGTITLRINPSISEVASDISANNADRKMPPDLSRRQLSSVISVKDGNRVILGGLINTKNVNDTNKVPLLGDIPVLGHLFKREGITKQTEEIVIIIEPHIVKKESDKLSLSDLGYTRLGNKIEEEAKQDTK